MTREANSRTRTLNCKLT